MELERALAVGDRANNAVLQEHDGRWTVQGDPTEGALLVAAHKAGLEDEALDARFRAARRSSFFLRAQADDHGPFRRRARRAPSRLHQGRARCAAGALLARTGRRPGEAAGRRAPRRDPQAQRRAGRRSPAHARRRLPPAARSGARPRWIRRTGGARAGVRRADRDDGPAARRGEGGGGAREGRGNTADHDHRRSSGNRGSRRHGAGHRFRAACGHRRRAREDVRRSAQAHGARGVGLRAGESRAQAAHREGAAGGRRRSWR